MDGNFEHYLLHQLVKSDVYLEELRALLDLGVDPNYQSIGGLSLLHAAAMSYMINIEVIQELIRRGAKIDLNDQLSYTALHYSVVNCKQSAVIKLLESGAMVNAKTFLGETPFHLAVRRFQNKNLTILIPDPLIIQDLLKQEDIDCNLRDHWGNTPLMVAIKERQIEAAKLLLDYKANTNVSNNVSETPLHVAFSERLNYTAYELLLNGASIYAVNSEGQTPMDIFLENIASYKTIRRLAPIFLKLITLKYHVTEDLKQKLERFANLSQLMKSWCEEVNLMRNDYITDKITFHDVALNCFQEPEHSEILMMQLHKCLIKSIMLDLYPEYILEIFSSVSAFTLRVILEMIVYWRKKSKWRNDPKLFSNVDIIYLLSSYLSRLDMFCLIISISNIKVPGTMRNIHKGGESLLETTVLIE